METNINSEKQNKTIAIIGSRDFKNKQFLALKMAEIDAIYTITHVVSGGAKGADTLGVQWANKHKIPSTIFHADFKNRKRAYHFRDRQIARAVDIVVAFWNGYSTGTKYTVNFAKSIEKEVVVFKF